MIADGAGLIFSTSFDDDPFLLAMAKKYPDVVFRQASALANSDYPQNVGSQNALINQGHYVNGVAAGLCTTTNKLGFVAGMPFGPVLLNVNSFLLGCRQTNPEATVRVIFTGGWEDAAHDAAATNALVDAGCDVIACHLDAPQVVIETAETPRRQDMRSCLRPGARSRPRATSPAPTTIGPTCSRHFVETLQKGGTLPNFVTGGYDKDYVGSSPFGAGATPAGDQCRQDRHAGDEERGRNLRRSHQGQHREARGAGRNDLRALCRRASADRLSDRGRQSARSPDRISRHPHRWRTLRLAGDLDLRRREMKKPRTGGAGPLRFHFGNRVTGGKPSLGHRHTMRGVENNSSKHEHFVTILRRSPGQGG